MAWHGKGIKGTANNVLSRPIITAVPNGRTADKNLVSAIYYALIEFKFSI